MTLDGAVLNEQGVTFALATVPPAFLKNPNEAEELRSNLERQFFRGLPVLLMARDWTGMPSYYGDAECSRVMHAIHVSRIAWSRYTVG